MAALPDPPLVSVDEYLNSSYQPDLEFVDGLLVERSMSTIAHAVLQSLLGAYFYEYRRQFRFVVMSEARTQIIERKRYRLPDVMLSPTPLPLGKVMTHAPWVIIEILSPEDKLPEQLKCFRDFAGAGVLHVVLLDPEELVAYRYQHGSLSEAQFTTLELPTGSLPFDSEAVFRQLTEELAAGRG